MWSPRFGLILKPQANISLYASYARSFLPQSGDQFTCGSGAGRFRVQSDLFPAR